MGASSRRFRAFIPNLSVASIKGRPITETSDERRTMTITPAFITRTATAKRLGMSYDTLRSRMVAMVRSGFPEIDPIMDRYVTADVEAWIESLRQIKTGDILEVHHTQEVNTDAL
jgi:hypothetical protein